MTSCLSRVKKCVVIATNPKHMVLVIIRTAYAYSWYHVTKGPVNLICLDYN